MVRGISLLRQKEMRENKMGVGQQTLTSVFSYLAGRLRVKIKSTLSSVCLDSSARGGSEQSEISVYSIRKHHHSASATPLEQQQQENITNRYHSEKMKELGQNITIPGILRSGVERRSTSGLGTNLIRPMDFAPYRNNLTS